MIGILTEIIGSPTPHGISPSRLRSNCRIGDLAHADRRRANGTTGNRSITS